MRRIWILFTGSILTLTLFPLPAHADMELFAIHSDHLGTPQVITDKDKRVVWKARAKPFGKMEVEIEEVTHHQRFPGQRFDIETRLHYNYFRDYDPGLGRYIQSDPIGLNGGLNTYLYADQNPILYWDFYGLAPGQGGKGRSSSAPGAGVTPMAQTASVLIGSTVFTWDQGGTLSTFQTTAIGVGAFLSFCPPPKDPCEEPAENSGLMPDSVSAGWRNLGVTRQAGGSYCFNIGPGVGLPGGASYNTNP